MRKQWCKSIKKIKKTIRKSPFAPHSCPFLRAWMYCFKSINESIHIQNVQKLEPESPWQVFLTWHPNMWLDWEEYLSKFCIIKHHIWVKIPYPGIRKLTAMYRQILARFIFVIFRPHRQWANLDWAKFFGFFFLLENNKISRRGEIGCTFEVAPLTGRK